MDFIYVYVRILGKNHGCVLSRTQLAKVPTSYLQLSRGGLERADTRRSSSKFSTNTLEIIIINIQIYLFTAL